MAGHGDPMAHHSGGQMPSGHQPGSMGQGGHHAGAGQIMPLRREGYVAGPANSSMAAVAQLFARLSQEIEEQQPANCVHFIVNFLCKHYPEHLHGFASIWNMDPDLERERHEVVNFFKSHKISTAVAAHFTNAGYDTLDTLTTLSPDQLVDVEAFNNVKWLPGHKVRLQQIFSEIPARIRAYRQAHPNQTSGIVGSPRGGLPISPGLGGGRAYSPPRALGQPGPGLPPRGLPAPMGHPALPPSMGRGGPPAGPMQTGPREYVVGVSAPVRVPQQALTGPTPDVFQQPHINYMGAPGMPGGAPGAPMRGMPGGVPGGIPGMQAPRLFG